jgi:transposase
VPNTPAPPGTSPCIAWCDLFGTGGTKLLDELALPAAYAGRIASLRRLIDGFDFEIDLYGRMLAARLGGHPGYTAVQALDGVGPTFAAVFVAEIGDVHRFPGAAALCSWAGLTPRHHESDTKVRRGRITKQGSTLVRWAAVEAVQRVRRGPVAAARVRIGDRRGTNIGKVAAARKLLTLVYYGLRDGHIRCLARLA